MSMSSMQEVTLDFFDIIFINLDEHTLYNEEHEKGEQIQDILALICNHEILEPYFTHR